MSLPNIKNVADGDVKQDEAKSGLSEIPDPLNETPDNKIQEQGNALVPVAIPVDGGYGWMVIFACFILSFMIDGMFSVFGVLMPAFIDQFDSTRAETVLIGSVLTASLLLSGPFISILANVFGCRLVAVSGAVVLTGGLILSSYAQSIKMLTFTFGVVSGIGLGLIYLPSVVMVSMYFEKKRSLANGLSTAGSGIGMLVLSPLTAVLLESFGWRLALLYLCCITLQSMVVGALLRPLEPQLKEPECVHLLGSLKAPVTDDALDNTKSPLQPIPEDDILPDVEFTDVSLLNTVAGSVYSQLNLSDSKKAIASSRGKISSPINIPKCEGSSASPYGTSPATPYGTYEGEIVTTSDNLHKTALRNAAAQDAEVSKSPVSQTPPTRIPIVTAGHRYSVSAVSEAPADMIIKKRSTRNGSFLSPWASAKMYEKVNPNIASEDELELSNSTANMKPPQQSNRAAKIAELKKIRQYYSCMELSQQQESETERRMPASNSKKYHEHQATGKPKCHLTTQNSYNVLTSQANIIKAALSNPFLRLDVFFMGSGSQLVPYQPRRESTASVMTMITQHTLEDVVKKAEEKTCYRIPKHQMRMVKSMLDISIFQNWTFWLIVLANMFLQVGASTACMFMVDFGVSLGLDSTKASSLISLFGVTNTLGRVLGGGISNLPHVDPLTITAISIMLSGVSCLLTVLAASGFWMALAGAGAIGFFLGPPVPLTPIFVVQYLGLQKLTNAFGILSLFKGVACLFGVPFAGWLRDKTGSFVGPFAVAFGLLVQCGLLHLLYPVTDKLQKRYNERKATKQNNLYTMPLNNDEDII